MTSLSELVTEKPVVWVEKTHRKEEGGTWIFCGLFDLGSVERKTAGRSSEVSLIYQVFTPTSDSCVFIDNRTIEINTSLCPLLFCNISRPASKSYHQKARQVANVPVI